MEEFWILILLSLFATNSFEKAESVQLKELEELPLQTFDELFVEEWLDKDEAEDLKTPPLTNFGQSHQIDRQNTQNGQIEPNSTDQNPALTESDHSDNAKNCENNKIIKEITSNKNIAEDEPKLKIIDKFHAMKAEFKKKGKYSSKEWVQIEKKIAKPLKVNRKKIYEWKKEFGLSRRKPKNERKSLVEKFDHMKAELTLAEFKNSYHHEIDETVAKELGLSVRTIYNWKRKLGQTAPNKHSHNERKELMKSYYEIKDQNSKISDVDIAKMLKIGSRTLVRWKREFNRQQLHPNSVNLHSVEENAAANVQEIKNSNSGNIDLPVFE